MGCDYYEETLLWDFTNHQLIHEIASVPVYCAHPSEGFTRHNSETWYAEYYMVYEFYVEKHIQTRKDVYHHNVAHEKEKQKAQNDIALLERACKVLGDSGPAVDAIAEKIEELKKVMARKRHPDSDWKIPYEVDIVSRDRER